LGTAEAALAASWSQLTPIIGEAAASCIQKGCDAEKLLAALNWAEQPNHFLLSAQALDYPEELRHIANPPPLLYGIGRRELLKATKLAMVGSRNPTPQGERNAEVFARALSEASLTIVSGLAQGIDTAAHRGGLQGTGSSIAVVGTGLDRVYPARNHELAKMLSADGLLLSEFPLGTPPLAGNFPRRNRIISGLSKGCLVVEAAIGSGSLITAALAAEQGREVFAIPGSIHSPLSKGCHSLIKQGAKLVETAQDLLEELHWHVSHTIGVDQESNYADLSENGTKLLEAIGYDPVDLDSLCERAEMGIDVISAMLLQFELAGLVTVLPGNLYQRAN